jgi:hypothetical protein
MKSLQWRIAALSLLALSEAAFAQNHPAPVGGCNTQTSTYHFASGTAVGFAPDGVKNIPFSADVVHEFTHVLADGNRIHRETHGKLFRDAEGRSRDEIELETPGRMGPQVRITIHDPLSRTTTIVFPQTKTAVAYHSHEPARIGVGVGTGWGSGIGGGTEVKPAAKESELPKNLEFVQAKSGLADAPQSGPHTKIEQLGRKEIEGFSACGARDSHIIPTGEIGNEKPIISTTETWIGEDLRLVLFSAHDDPQTGEAVTRLVNIRVGDPDPQLFEIPSDYTLKDIPPSDTAAKPGPQ